MKSTNATTTMRKLPSVRAIKKAVAILEAVKPARKTKRHWYFRETHLCPVCGSEKHYRERRYTRKPKFYVERFRLMSVYDHCMDDRRA